MIGFSLQPYLILPVYFLFALQASFLLFLNFFEFLLYSFHNTHPNTLKNALFVLFVSWPLHCQILWPSYRPYGPNQHFLLLTISSSKFSLVVLIPCFPFGTLNHFSSCVFLFFVPSCYYLRFWFSSSFHCIFHLKLDVQLSLAILILNIYSLSFAKCYFDASLFINLILKKQPSKVGTIAFFFCWVFFFFFLFFWH